MAELLKQFVNGLEIFEPYICTLAIDRALDKPIPQFPGVVQTIPALRRPALRELELLQTVAQLVLFGDQQPEDGVSISRREIAAVQQRDEVIDIGLSDESIHRAPPPRWDRPRRTLAGVDRLGQQGSTISRKFNFRPDRLLSGLTAIQKAAARAGSRRFFVKEA
jgi:hypothetical protein